MCDLLLCTATVCLVSIPMKLQTANCVLVSSTANVCLICFIIQLPKGTASMSELLLCTATVCVVFIPMKLPHSSINISIFISNDQSLQMYV